MKNTKKYLFGLTCSTLLLMGIVTVFANNRLTNIDTTFSGIKHSYATTPVSENYTGYHKATTRSTLIHGVQVVFVRENLSGFHVSKTTLNASHYLDSQTIEVTDGHFDYADPFYLTKEIISEKTFSVFSDSFGNKLGYSPAGSYNGQIAPNGTVYATTVTIEDGKTSIKFKDYVRYVSWTSGEPYNGAFYAYTENNKYVDIYVNVDSVVQAWAATYLHMDLDVDNQCLTYTAPARNALLAMDSYVIADLYYNASFKEYKDRYEAWCAHQELDPYHE